MKHKAGAKVEWTSGGEAQRTANLIPDGDALAAYLEIFDDKGLLWLLVQ
jgi:hypothetical protein